MMVATGCHNSAPAPELATFKLDASAQAILTKAFAVRPEGFTTGLNLANGTYMTNPKGEVISKTDGELFIIGFDRERTQITNGSIPIRLNGMTVWTMPSTQELLQGETLTAVDQAVLKIKAKQK